MTDERYFGHLRLRGGRYELGGLPLSGVTELARYQNLLKAVAKALFRSDSGHRRVPNGFLDNNEIVLVRLGKGSVYTYLDEVGTSSSQGAFEGREMVYLLRAQRVVNEIYASMVEHDEPAHQEIAAVCAKEFSVVGKSLSQGESIEFYEKRHSTKPRAYLDQTLRQSLELYLTPSLKAQPPVELILRERTLYGHVSGLRSKPPAFDLLTENAGQIEANYSDPARFQMLQRVLGHGDRAPLVAIEVLVDESDAIVDVRHVESVLPTEWQERLQHLAGLDVGWLEPGSPPPSEASLRFTEQVLLTLLDQEVSRPGIFPEAEGGVQLEWSTGPQGSGVEVVIPNEGRVSLFRLHQGDYSDHVFPQGTDSRTIASAVKEALP